KGDKKIDFIYKDAEIFSNDGLAPVKDKLWGFIDTTGKLVIPQEYEISVAMAFAANLFGVDVSTGFIDGLSRVKTKKGWGFIDKNGKLLGNKWYKNAELFVDTSK